METKKFAAFLPYHEGCFLMLISYLSFHDVTWESFPLSFFTHTQLSTVHSSCLLSFPLQK